MSCSGLHLFRWIILHIGTGCTKHKHQPPLRILLVFPSCHIQSTIRFSTVVEDVGVEPLYNIPNVVCYRYTTSSIFTVVLSLKQVNHRTFGAGDGIRTHNSIWTEDFKSSAYSNSATPAYYLFILRPLYVGVNA